MNRQPLREIAAEDVAAYERDGVVCLRQMFDGEWIEHIAGAIAEARARPGDNAQDHTVAGEAGGFFSDLQVYLRVPAFARLHREGPAGAIAGRLMGATRVNLLHDAMWVKEPGTSRSTPWHHDQPFYCVEGDRTMVLWLSVDPVPRDVCLEFIAGSHRWGRNFRPERINGGWYDGYCEDDGFEAPPDMGPESRGSHQILGWDLRPGDCIAFHGMTLHGAPGNASATPRRAMSVVMAGDGTTYVERAGETQPSYDGCGLAPGDAIDNDYFWRMWTRPSGAAHPS
jgi:ectoine hydroxylase-related dioxygenase (phytanoyl-CoA dioxygenase family)